jgi:hypothetical protein
MLLVELNPSCLLYFYSFFFFLLYQHRQVIAYVKLYLRNFSKKNLNALWIVCIFWNFKSDPESIIYTKRRGEREDVWIYFKKFIYYTMFNLNKNTKFFVYVKKKLFYINKKSREQRILDEFVCRNIRWIQFRM